MTAGSIALARRIAGRLGVDRAVAMTLLGRGFQIAAAPFTLFFIARSLTPVEQGFYYTFASVLALQVFFELGLSLVLLQYVSHERVGLDNDTAAAARISSALHQAIRWYAVVSVLIVIALIPAGLLFFAKTGGGAHVTWRWPWAILVAGTAANLMTVPFAAVLQGLGLVAEVAQVRLWQSVVQNAALWAALIGGLGLYTAGIASVASALAALMMARGSMGKRLGVLLHAHDANVRVSWKHEIWPFQWRIAVSSVCGYLTFQMFNPILFASRGPVEAGRLGMSLAIAGAISTVAMAWIQTRAPEYGELIARREWHALDALFARGVRQTMFVCTSGLVAFWAGVELLRITKHPFASRVVDPATLALLGFATIINVFLFAESMYLRAHKDDPFMVLTMVNAAAMAGATMLAGPRYGAFGIMAGYLLVSLIAGLGPGTWIFLTKRREYRMRAL